MIKLLNDSSESVTMIIFRECYMIVLPNPHRLSTGIFKLAVKTMYHTPKQITTIRIVLVNTHFIWGQKEKLSKFFTGYKKYIFFSIFFRDIKNNFFSPPPSTHH